MASKYFMLIISLIILLFSNSYCNLEIVETSISINSEMQSTEITHTDKLHLFSATFDRTLGKFILLLLAPKDYENEYNHIFVSIPGDSDDYPTYKNSDYKTVDKNTTLLIETKNIPPNKNTAKITIECKEYCDFTLFYQIVTNIPLFDDRSFDLILNGNEEFVLEYEPELINDFNNKFTFFSNAPSDFSLKIIYNDTDNISPLTEFYNGYGLFIDNEAYPDGGKFTFKLSHYGKPNELVHISNRKLTKEIKNLNVGDFHNSITGITHLEKECFNLPKISEDAEDKNYNLNFLTYTKNILITLDNTDKFVINSESDLIQINAKQYSEICFSSNNGKIATTTFQLLDGTEQTINQDMQMPLYRGVPKKAKLVKGQIAYYRLYFYPSFSKNLIMNLKSIEGKAKLYYGICSDYPNCNFQEDQLINFESEKDINNNAFMKKEINENMTKPYSDPEFQVAIVYCTNENNEKDCEYFITLSNDNDEINIIENQRYYSSVKNYNIDKYQFNIYDSNNELEYLFINLYSYTGQANIAIYSDKEMTKEITQVSVTAIQNKEIVLISASNLIDKTLNGNYYIKVKGLSNTVYSIYYYTAVKDTKTTENNLISNEVNIQNLKPNNQEYTYLIKNNAKHKNTPFLFEYNSLNCDLEVSLTGESGTINERYHQYIIDNTKTYYNDDYYQMKIKAKNADISGAYPEIDCLVALMGGEIEQNKEIVLSDGVIQKGKLTKKINYINYLYTFTLNKLEEDVSLFFQKDSNYNIDLSYAFGNSDLKTYKVVNNDKSIVFTQNDFGDICIHYNESCSLKIQIKINEEESLADNSYVDFILTLNNKVTYPSYLLKDNLIKNNLLTNQYQYYYLDIGKNEECEIFLDFNEGFGEAIAKIVKKDSIEDNANYNRRVILPLPGMTDNYIFNQYTKNLKITKEMTSKCENGCEIYLAVFHVDQRFTDYVSSYNIYYRKNNNLVYIPENTIVHGNLKSIEEKNIFQTKINKKTNMVVFNLLGDHTMAYINKGETIPTSESKDYFIDSEKEKQLIIKSDSFEGQIFTFVVSTNKLENNSNRNYDIKIDVPYSEAVNIKYIDYLHNNPCYFSKDNTKCHYMLPVEKYNKENKLYLFTPDNINTLIYANYISMEEFDTLTNDEKIEKLPKKQSDSKNYLIIDISSNIKDIYVLITVETNIQNESFANLIIGGYYHASTTYLRPNTYSFYSITDDHVRNKLNLAIESQGLYQISFVLISGKKGIIAQSESNKYLEFNDNNNKALTFLFEPELKNTKLFSIKFNASYVDVNDINTDEEEEGLLFYTYLESRSNNSNIAEIKTSDILEQKFEYLKNELYKNFFPISFYELVQKGINKDKQFIFQVFDGLPSLSGFKDLTIEGYILSKTSIEDIKINPNNLENEKKIVNGKYYNNFLVAQIAFTKDIIEKYAVYNESYFYINIKYPKDEIIQLDYAEIDIFKSSFSFVDINKYETLKVKGKENKHLFLVLNPREAKMAIDFFVVGNANINDFNITVRSYTDENEDYSKNENSIIEYRRFEYKRYYYMVFLNQYIHYMVADVIKNNYDSSNDDGYILKYRVENSYPAYYYLESNRTIVPILEGTKLVLDFNGIRECDKGCTYHDNFVVNYVINFYDNALFEGKEINNMIVNENPIYTYNLIKKGKDDTIEKVNWEIEIQKYDGKEQLVQVIGYASYDGNEESFVYDTFKITYKEVLVDREFEFWIIMFSFIGVVIITFGAMYVYIYAKIEIGRRTLMLNNANNISLIQRSSDRTSGNTNTRQTI